MGCGPPGEMGGNAVDRRYRRRVEDGANRQVKRMGAMGEADHSSYHIVDFGKISFSALICVWLRMHVRGIVWPA